MHWHAASHGPSRCQSVGERRARFVPQSRLPPHQIVNSPQLGFRGALMADAQGASAVEWTARRETDERGRMKNSPSNDHSSMPRTPLTPLPACTCSGARQGATHRRRPQRGWSSVEANCGTLPFKLPANAYAVQFSQPVSIQCSFSASHTDTGACKPWLPCPSGN